MLSAGPVRAQGETLEETLARLRAERTAQDAGEKGEAPKDARGTLEDPFSDTVEVRLVEVEVVVTKGGERVRGLEREDFRLLVDGEEVPIQVFEEVRREGTKARPEAARDILVFVDDYFTDRGTRKRLLANLEQNLDALGPADRMAVVRFAGWGLEVWGALDIVQGGAGGGAGGAAGRDTRRHRTQVRAGIHG